MLHFGEGAPEEVGSTFPTFFTLCFLLFSLHVSWLFFCSCFSPFVRSGFCLLSPQVFCLLSPQVFCFLLPLTFSPPFCPLTAPVLSPHVSRSFSPLTFPPFCPLMFPALFSPLTFPTLYPSHFWLLFHSRFLPFSLTSLSFSPLAFPHITSHISHYFSPHIF